ncbi:hypothetical protein MCOR25_004066 [Pyricularia grisea]|uniref:2'-phosphotransferase n=1 Tax=Pyricularia grisea TaxID=148305 RepID=A0A6P8ATI7_PYRGI|nr:uncharacterized protein PgNI_09528 [Pyricularia grisea]KAI6370934.1 hypothetical protein MCOR25_004066 [Pyricularia grisea]TLD05402.1 hypothetical protein PgNI_09528 [Pyricularia grisea]
MYIKRPKRPQTLQTLFQNVTGSTGTTPHTFVANNSNTITLAREASQRILARQDFTKQPSSQQTHTLRHQSHLAWHPSPDMDGQGRSRRGGRGGGGGGGGSQSRDVGISRALSRLLRHQAANAGIQLDGEGYAPLDKVLAWGPIKSLKVTLPEIREAVSNSDKQRFGMKPRSDSVSADSTDPADFMIRANQGHSIKLESAEHLTAVTVEAGNVPEVVVHGTYYAFWPAIVASGGLRPMGRNHVHCSTGLPGPEAQVVSGMRRDAELLVYLDVERALRDGETKWWLSDNGVVLTEGGEAGLVPVKYFKEVVGRRPDEVGVLWKDGEKVADLPEGLKIKVPAGKERVGGGAGRGRGGGRGRGSRGGRGGRGDVTDGRTDQGDAKS